MEAISGGQGQSLVSSATIRSLYVSRSLVMVAMERLPGSLKISCQYQEEEKGGFPVNIRKRKEAFLSIRKKRKRPSCQYQEEEKGVSKLFVEQIKLPIYTNPRP